MRISSAHRIGMPPFGAARVEQKIVKIPQHQVVIALGPAQAAFRAFPRLERHLAVNQQAKELCPREPLLLAQLSNLLRRGQHRHEARGLRIADLEQSARAWRFQHHSGLAAVHIGEAREDDPIGIVQLRYLRPVAGNPRLDDEQILPVLPRIPGAVFQEAEASEAPDQDIHFLGRASAPRRERG